MAKTCIIFLTFLIISTFTIADQFSEVLAPEKLGLKEEKLTHLHFYFHDIVSGPKPSAVRVAQAAVTNSSQTAFGAVNVMDDALTEAPEPGSKVVGRAQGIYASASQSELGLLMVLNFAFTEGKFNGSALRHFGPQHGVFDSEGDADRRRQWGFPICPWLCSGENSYT
ncbi:hypothetical protein Patl1_32907 [Pistacia atlantica]|uniref:Uncharacterized protein n=1 Tax=Pistacia atlantica TaxID=434234 RepID=A0ACC1AMR9_9ROSI|nr:hypothetical protein Patl1_32907 [Pistacia atlantica]